MNRLHDIDAALRSLDSAHDYVDPTSSRARTDLRRILASTPAPETHQQQRPQFHRVARPVKTRRKVALAGAALAAGAVGVVALPSLTGGDQAFATWTHAPAGMTAQESAEAAAGCRESQEDGGPEYADQLTKAETAVAERRGAWTTVLLAGTDGFSALCITDDSAGLFTSGMIGSVGIPSDFSAPAPRELVATDLGMGIMDAGEISLAAGAAGADVVEVVYPSPTHGDVTATVSHGRFALWLPGDALKHAASEGVEVEVTYRDGSTGTSQLRL